jgi:23S rRNA pseudouridine1911/1915/1917 synthase
MEKVYLAVTDKPPHQPEWICRLSLAPDPHRIGRIIAHKGGKPAETAFRVIATGSGRALIEARPYTGRTHQIRVHLAQSGSPIIGDELYGRDADEMALRAVGLSYRDPFTRRIVMIRAATEGFLKQYGFDPRTYNITFTGSSAANRPTAKPHFNVPE